MKNARATLATLGVVLLIALTSGSAVAARLVDARAGTPASRTVVLESPRLAIPSKNTAKRPAQNRTMLIVKLDDIVRASLSRGRLVAPSHKDPEILGAITRINDVVARFDGELVPLLSVAPGVLDKRRVEAQQRTAAPLTDLTQFFRIWLPEGAPSKDIAAALAGTPYIQAAYIAPRMMPLPGDVGVTTPSFVADQTYAGPAPLGIDVDHVYTQTSIDADGVTIVDVEQCWLDTHEDLMTISADVGVNVGEGPSPDLVDHPDTERCSHGTAVLGILSGDDDPPGIAGLVPGATIRFSSVFRDDESTAGTGDLTADNISDALGLTYDPWNAMSAVALEDAAPLQAGDVLLVEQQFAGPHTPVNSPGCYGCVPVEYDFAMYWIIRQITALNIHVIEAGANGSQDLDNLVNDAVPGQANSGTGHPGYTRFDFTTAYSGAIVTGAASADVAHHRLGFSSFGERVDAFAWGEDIATTGYGPLRGGNLFPGAGQDERQWYTSAFGGTSGSSPIVTSAVALLQSQHRDLYGEHYHTDAMRLLLRTTGTPSADPAIEWIGHQPDLKLQTELVRSGPNLAIVMQGDGNPSNGRLGGAVAYVGDQDGDTFGDIAVAENDTLGGDPTVHVYSGVTGQPIQSLPLPGTGRGAQFVRLANAGDVDFDGTDDLLVSVGANDVTVSGNVYVFTGLIDAPAIYRQYSGAPGSWFGFSIAAIDDVNNDGFRDFLAGAPHQEDNCGANLALKDCGAVYILSGAASYTVIDRKKGVPDSQFGYAVTALEDWNGDGRGDFAVGAPLYEYGSYGVIGRAFVYDGPSRSLHETYFCDMAVGDLCGHVVADGGDLSGDGLSDLLVGAPGFLGNQGGVFGFSSDYGYLTHWTDPNASETGSSVLSLDCEGCGALPSTLIGSRTPASLPDKVSLVGDVLGNKALDYESPLNGGVYGSVLASGDINFDNRDDVIIADPNNDRVYVHLR